MLKPVQGSASPSRTYDFERLNVCAGAIDFIAGLSALTFAFYETGRGIKGLDEVVPLANAERPLHAIYRQRQRRSARMPANKPQNVRRLLLIERSSLLPVIRLGKSTEALVVGSVGALHIKRRAIAGLK